MNVSTISALFAGHGASLYGGERISQTDHALQCATLAEQAGEPPTLIAAALLHDLGHFLMAEDGIVDRRHQDVAAEALQGWFSETMRPATRDAVIAPIRLHVAAKRYLCAVESDYWDTLSQASKDSLVLQGGPFDASGLEAFRAEPHYEAAVRLRRYDDSAKVVGAWTGTLPHFLGVLETLVQAA